MFLWILALVFVFHFCYGVLLPVIPALNDASAGTAFSAFLLFKLLYFIPAGILSDRLGHKRGLVLSLVLQVAALATMRLLPSHAWAGRLLEGMALAQGTVSSLAIARFLFTERTLFEKNVGAILSALGLGSILGPLAGFLLLPYGPLLVLDTLLILNGAFLLAYSLSVGTLRVPSLASFPAETTEPTPRGQMLWILVGFTGTKAIAVGWEPALAWWAQHTLQLSATLAGFSFILLGILFVVGTRKQVPGFALLGIIGFVALEFSLRGHNIAWWVALAMVGYWYGAYVTVAVSKLGWNRPEKIGQYNSLWMLISDFPMIFVPALLWNWRGESGLPARAALAAFFLILSLLGLLLGGSGFRAPKQSREV